MSGERREIASSQNWFMRLGVGSIEDKWTFKTKISRFWKAQLSHSKSLLKYQTIKVRSSINRVLFVKWPTVLGRLICNFHFVTLRFHVKFGIKLQFWSFWMSLILMFWENSPFKSVTDSKFSLSDAQISHKIKFGNISRSKSAIFVILEALNFDFWENFTCEIV